MFPQLFKNPISNMEGAASLDRTSTASINQGFRRTGIEACSGQTKLHSNLKSVEFQK